MSENLRKARAILAAFPQLPKAQVYASVFTSEDREVLFEPPKKSIAFQSADLSPLSESVSRQMVEHYQGAGVAAAFALPVCIAVDQRFTGTISGRLFFLGGKFFKNALFWTICGEGDHYLLDTLANYFGRGLAETNEIASADETEAIEHCGHSAIWYASIFNLCSACSWQNHSLRHIDDPAARFRTYICDNAFEATWDALSELLLLGKPLLQHSFVPNDFQRAILAALDGRALKKQQLANEVCKGEGTLLYRKDALSELREAGLVAHKNRLGFYRPDRPPPIA